MAPAGREDVTGMGEGVKGRTGENLDEAFELLRKSNEGALGTVEEGRPFVSGAGFFYEEGAAEARDYPWSRLRGTRPKGRGEAGGKILFLLSDLARHTKNLARNPAASLLIVEAAGGPIHEKKRLTLQGAVRRVEGRGEFERLKEKYLAVFPRAAIFFTLPDFRFYEMRIEEAHWIGGFGKAATVRV